MRGAEGKFSQPFIIRHGTSDGGKQLDACVVVLLLSVGRLLHSTDPKRLSVLPELAEGALMTARIRSTNFLSLGASGNRY